MKNLFFLLLVVLVSFSCHRKMQLVIPEKYKRSTIHSIQMKNYSFKQSFLYTISDTPDSTLQFIGKKKDYLKRLKKSYHEYERYNRKVHLSQNLHSMILKDYMDTIQYLSVLQDTLRIDFRRDFFERRNQYYRVSGYGISFTVDERNFLNKKFRKGKLVLLHNGKPYTNKVIWRREIRMDHSNRWWGKCYYLGSLNFPFYSMTEGSVHIRWAR